MLGVQGRKGLSSPFFCSSALRLHFQCVCILYMRVCIQTHSHVHTRVCPVVDTHIVYTHIYAQKYIHVLYAHTHIYTHFVRTHAYTQKHTHTFTYTVHTVLFYKLCKVLGLSEAQSTLFPILNNQDFVPKTVAPGKLSCRSWAPCPPPLPHRCQGSRRAPPGLHL